MKTVTTYALSVAALVAGTMLPIRSLMAQQGDPPPGTYQAREDHQQDRIANGVQSGALTAGETKSLEHQEASLNGQAAADRAADGGKLTAAQRGQLNSEQSHLSNEIHTDKTNAATAHYGNNEVGQRRGNQQDRIRAGHSEWQPVAQRRVAPRGEGTAHQRRGQRGSEGRRRPFNIRREIVDQPRTEQGESRDLPRQAQREAQP